MGLLFGIGFLTVTWCLLVVWVGRIAGSRGRNMFVWAAIAGGAGALGTISGFMLAQQIIEASEVSSTLSTVLALFTPVVALVLPMVGVGSIVARGPIHVARRGIWKISVLGKGNGTVEIGESIAITIDGVKRTFEPADLKVEADGECVRIGIADSGGDEHELVAMPMGKPDTPAGRKHQSLMLAKQLRQAKSVH